MNKQTSNKKSASLQKIKSSFEVKDLVILANKF